MKKCINCLQIKGLSEYYAHKQMGDGHLNACKSCVKARVKAYSSTDKGKEVEARRNGKPERKIKLHDYWEKRYSNQREQIYARQRRWAVENPEKVRASRRRSERAIRLDPVRRAKKRARQKLGWHVKVGNILRLPCATCGSLNVEAHHYDYDKPLEVVWLCMEHHRQVHNPLDKKSNI